MLVPLRVTVAEKAVAELWSGVHLGGSCGDVEAQPLLVSWGVHSRLGFWICFLPSPGLQSSVGLMGPVWVGWLLGALVGLELVPASAWRQMKPQPLQGAGEQCEKLRQKLAQGKEREGGSIHPAATMSLFPL